MKHTPKKGVGSGVGNTGSFFSSLPAAAPAFPKQQHLQAGAQLEGRAQFNKTGTLIFFSPVGLIL